MPMGQERTKEQLYKQAKRLDIKGRSKMNKGQLKAALARRGHSTDLIYPTSARESGRWHY